MADTMTLQAAAYSAQGTPREKVALPGATFDGTINLPVMHQAVKAYLANQRQGTHSTKTRGEVVGGNQKPWKQKGTGRARSGSTRSPVWVGGGTVFGPRPRKYTEVVPRQVRALARKSALNARASEGAILVIDAFQYDAPKTAKLQQLLARLDVAARKVLILTDGAKPNVYLSGRNMPDVMVLPFSDVSTYHILWSDVVLIESGAVGEALAPLTEKALAPVKVKKATKAAKTADEAPAKKKKAAAGTAAKTAPAKPAARKTAVKKTAAPKKKGK